MERLWLGRGGPSVGPGLDGAGRSQASLEPAPTGEEALGPPTLPAASLGHLSSAARLAFPALVGLPRSQVPAVRPSLCVGAPLGERIRGLQTQEAGGGL